MDDSTKLTACICIAVVAVGVWLNSAYQCVTEVR
jgi:hypothetical protein